MYGPLSFSGVYNKPFNGCSFDLPSGAKKKGPFIPEWFVDPSR
jgi:hypothetical protein